jgi:predicted secreted Zn-dependent protease
MSVTKLFCLKKGNQYISWDGKTMADRPSQAGRFSRIICQRKYPGYEMLSFPDAYNHWYAEQKAIKEAVL